MQAIVKNQTMMQFFLKSSKFKNVIELRDAFFKEKAVQLYTKLKIVWLILINYRIRSD